MKSNNSQELKKFSKDMEIFENNIINNHLDKRETTIKNIENPLIQKNSISNNNNDEKILHSNLSSKIWEPNEFSIIMNQYKENEMSNSYSTFDNMEIEFLQTRKFIIPTKYIINKFDKDKREKLIKHILSINVSINKFNDNHILSPLIPINNLIEELNIKDNLNNILYYRKIK